MAFCGTCRRSFDAPKTSGICPHCGAVPSGWAGGNFALIGLGSLAIVAIALAVLLSGRRLEAPADSGIPVLPAATPTVVEFAPAKATLTLPRDWSVQRNDATELVLKHVQGQGAIRLRWIPTVKGRDAHLGLFREEIADLEVADFTLPLWPGAEGLALKRAGYPTVGASWLLPRGESALHFFFWGDPSVVPDLQDFWRELRFKE